jgi:hypothetical protein
VFIEIDDEKINVVEEDVDPFLSYSIFGEHPNVQIVYDDGSVADDEHVRFTLKSLTGCVYKNKHIKDLLNSEAYLGCNLIYRVNYLYFEKSGIIYELKIKGKGSSVKTVDLGSRMELHQFNYNQMFKEGEKCEYAKFINEIMLTTNTKSARN